MTCKCGMHGFVPGDRAEKIGQAPDMKDLRL